MSLWKGRKYWQMRRLPQVGVHRQGEVEAVFSVVGRELQVAASPQTQHQTSLLAYTQPTPTSQPQNLCSLSYSDTSPCWYGEIIQPYPSAICWNIDPLGADAHRCLFITNCDNQRRETKSQENACIMLKVSVISLNLDLICIICVWLVRKLYLTLKPLGNLTGMSR